MFGRSVLPVLKGLSGIFLSRRAALAIAGAVALTVCAAGHADAARVERTIVIKDHKFDPEMVEVPAEARVKLIIDNQDASPEEFESHDLPCEKIVAGNSKITIWVGPLPAGKYSFFGEFHEDTAKGTLVAK